MAYLDTQSLNEDLKTVAHNAIGSMLGGNSTLNSKHGQLFNVRDKIDKAYFSHHWQIPEDMKKKIAGWCKSAGGTLFEDNEKVNFSNVKGIFNKMKKKFLYTSNTITKQRDRIGSMNTRLANRSIGKGAMTTNTIHMPIYPNGDGGLRYYVYFTYDASDIYDLKVLIRKDDGADFEVKELEQWKSIDHEQFKK